MASVWQFFSHEGDYADLNEAAVCSRLAQALSIATVDGPSHDATDWSAFDELGEFFRRSFPYVFEAAEVEKVDHSLMLTLHGRDAGLDPVMFMGHMDVVPVVPGTEDDWEHGAFDGHMDDTYVWGRGALDMKDQVMGVLEAVEYALRHGWEFRRTLMLCLGQDEETLQSGARAMGRLLARRGVRLHFVVDEGDYLVTDLAHLGAPGRHCMTVGLAEKGYADVRLVVRSAGGHSSNPYGGTSLAQLAKAIDRVASSPWPAELIEVDRTMLAAIAPYVTEGPLARLVSGGRASIDAHAQEIADALIADFMTPYDDGGVDAIYGIYTRMESMLTQTPRARRLLPLEIVEGVHEPGEGEILPLYEFEPDPETVLDALLPMYVRSRVWFYLLQSAASQLASQQRAMKSATDNAKQLIERLTREANQARQAEITQEISEIVGGASALADAAAQD